ncbi:MAG: glycerophosphodiester phosphodiesterase [Lentisphaeria bacterium]|nr:glycerophosphodiester phosphodiesterase [Lentisphaeria bacterium]
MADESLPLAGVELPGRGLCAHRGAMDTHPENTLSAFREAIRCGAHMIEFDVYLTKDKKLVVIHDATVDRTTNGKGRVSNLTFEEIRRLDAGGWKSPKFKGEKVPTLVEALSVMPENIWLNVHLKGGEELGRQTANVIRRRDRLHQAFLACGTAAARGARAVEPGILICNMARQGNSPAYVSETLRMEAAFIQLCGRVSPAFRGFAEKLKKQGVRINYFGTDSPQTLRTLFDLGVEFPLVNKVSSSMKVAVELGIQPHRPVFRDEKSTKTRKQ